MNLKLSPEAKVGALFLASLALVAGFIWYLGVLNPFSSVYELKVGYNFAGGVEVGSPVRVMGIKVGKVKSIDFAPDQKSESGEEVKLSITLTISKEAWPTVHRDSRFYINLAGVIGEKFIEITPGAADSPPLQPGQFVRGEDPPRIDQLISQSYGLAGKILDMVEKNEGSVVDTVEKMNALVNNLNKTLVLLEKTSKNKEVGRVLSNVAQISDDILILTSKLRGQDAQKTMDLLHRLLWRLDKLDEPAIRNFLQKEGIKAKLF
ncbi:MAG: MCE family protein [Bdellovibrionaceae bacterium]|nr:MCE family protein [Pseudobdellovibrionaceae bacterium]